MMHNIILGIMALFTSTLWAQIPAGADAGHPTTVLMNTDSVYSQNKAHGWFIFNTHNVSSFSGNVINLKAALLPTSSRVIMFDTVMIRIVNLYDSTLTLLASDTLHSGDTSMVFTASVSINKWYYIETIADYPCDTCEYNEAVSLKLKIESLSTSVFQCNDPSSCILTIQQNSNISSSFCELVCNGNMNNVSSSMSSTLTVNTNTLNNTIPGVTGWVTPTPHTPDYFNYGASASVSVPCNVFGNQSDAPTSAPGAGYLGIIWGYMLPNSTQDYTEYIEAPLLFPLTAGKNYIISFLVSKADYAGYEVPAISVYLTPNIICEPNNIGGPGVLSSTNIPVFTYTNTTVLNDPNNWRLISFCYTATGGERYITIGRPNFYPYNLPYSLTPSTPIYSCSSPTPFPNVGYYAYLFIDNVSVKPLDATIVTNTNNCTMNVSVTSMCPGDPFNSFLSNNISYQWIPVAGLTSPTSSVTSVTTNASSSYSVIVTYSGVSGTCNVIASTTNIPIPPSLTITANNPTICLGNSTTLSVTGAANYTWLPVNSSNSTIVVSPTTSTTYTVIGVGPLTNCPSTSTISINVFSCCVPPSDYPVTLSNATLVAYNTTGALPWSSITGGNIYTGLIAAPSSSVISGGKYNIIGNIALNTSLTISNVEMVFNTDGALMLQNQPLLITNSYLHACNQMWKGILSNHQLTILHSFIEDAQAAIITSNANHPGVSLNDVLFNKNYTAVSIGNTINSGSPNNFRITNCIFTSRQIPPPTTSQLSSPLLWRNIPPYTLSSLNTAPTALLLGSTMLGIPNTIRGQNGVVFQMAKFTNNTPLIVGQWTNNHAQINIFDNLGNYAIGSIFGSKMIVMDNYFNNILPGPDPLSAMRKAIITALSSSATIGYSPNYTFTAMTNTFVNCATGVYATANASLAVTNNSFVSNSIGVEIEQLGQNSYVNTVVKNTFQNCNYDVKSTNNKAILLQVNDNTSTYTPPSISKLVPVYNVYAVEPAVSNLVSYTINGNNFRGKRTGGVFFQNISNSFITSNYIEMVPSLGGTNYISNVGLENTQKISVTDNTLTCNPSSTSSWNNFGILNSFGQNNEFCGNLINKVGICMKHQGISPSVITNNVFNNNTADKALIGIWLAINGFIGDIEYNTVSIQHAPAGNIFGNKKMPLSTQYDFQIADTYVSNNSMGSKIYVNTFPPFNNPYVPLVNLQDIPTCIPCNLFSVVNSSYPNQLATCVNLPTSIKLSPGVPQFIANPSAVQPVPVIRRVAEKSVFEFIRKNNLNIGSWTNGNSFAAAEYSSNHGKFLQIDSLAEKYVQTQNPSLLTLAKSLNNSVLPVYPSDVTQKNYNEVYLTFIQHDSLITAAHIDTLRSIAGKCPYTEGTAVYQARALLSKYDTLVYYNGCEVTTVNLSSNRLMFQNHIVSEDEEAMNIMVYPNPASDFITIWAPRGSVFYAYDISGKLVLVQEMSNAHSRVVNVKDISEGVYIYKIIKDNRLLKADKLILKGGK